MAGLGPRRPHPPPSHPTIARVSPMVPEASLFMSASHADHEFGGHFDGGGSDEAALRSHGQFAAAAQSFKPSRGAATLDRPIEPPAPQRPSHQALIQPTTDFSRLFDSSGQHSLVDMATAATVTTGTAAASGGGYGRAPPQPQRITFQDAVEPFHTSHPSNIQSLKKPAKGQTLAAATPPRVNHDEAQADFKLVGAQDSPVHPEILAVLNWQNEQLRLLQQQVQVLLQASPQTKPAEYGTSAASSSLPANSCSSAPGCVDNSSSPPSSSHAFVAAAAPADSDSGTAAAGKKRPSYSSVSTNTSNLWPEIQRGLHKLNDAVQKDLTEKDDGPNLADMRKSEIKVSNGSDTCSQRSPQPTIHIDLPDYPGSEGSPDLRKQVDRVSWESPVLGESVSMYEEQRNTEVYNDILNQVNRLLGQPPPHQTLGQPPPHQTLGQPPSKKPPPQQPLGQPSPQQPLGQPPPQQLLGQPTPQQPLGHPQQPLGQPSPLQPLGQQMVDTAVEREAVGQEQPLQTSGAQGEDPTLATLNRLREMGISFILPDDLARSSRAEDGRSQPDYSNLFLPRAACPSSSVWRDSPDTSLEISSLALKYLDEAQLSSLADKHRQGAAAAGRAAQAGPNTTVRSENNMSMATQQFLNRHGLGHGGAVAAGGGASTARDPLRSIQNRTANTSQSRQAMAAAEAGLGLGGFTKQPAKTDACAVQPDWAGYSSSQAHAASQNQSRPAAGHPDHQHRHRVRILEPAAGRAPPPPPPGQGLEGTPVSRRPGRTSEKVANRVLDIEAIKRQPKLM